MYHAYNHTDTYETIVHKIMKLLNRNSCPLYNVVCFRNGIRMYEFDYKKKKNYIYAYIFVMKCHVVTNCQWDNSIELYVFYSKTMNSVILNVCRK